MLKLLDISKSYKTFDFSQTALDCVSVSFRDNEFAAILGPSGSGKTTLLNIVGGLDHYDSGDLEIDGISTKKYKASDWDTYRNNRIGFVFQSYNLISHQSVLANVELALTLSGVSRAERRERALQALEDVGLEEHARKLPNQLSGGQMQRVALARALINDPEILLADEPTGALDTKTSEQVMDLLKNIAKDRLVIMVTHNPELADQYANRIIQLKDGKVLADSNPFNPDEAQRDGNPVRRVSMSFFTAISLSLSNLMTKKGRTFVTALAGSIGIIGIAAILALANGINEYIANIEQETMSIYPLTIQNSGMDFSSLFASMGLSDSEEEEEEAPIVTDSTVLKERKVVQSLFENQTKNDLASLKQYIEDTPEQINPYVKNIGYTYNITPQIYLGNTTNGAIKVNPDSLLSSYGMGGGAGMSSLLGSGMGGTNIFHEMPGDLAMFDYQYNVQLGRWPEKFDEAVLVLMPDGGISDYVLYSLGIRNRDELKEMVDAFMNNPDADVEIKDADIDVTYSQVLDADIRVVHASKRYEYDNQYNVWKDKSENESYMKNLVNESTRLKIVGVIKADPDATATSLSPGINYTPELIDYLMEEASKEAIVADQIKTPSINVLTGKTFAEEKEERSASGFDFADLISVDEDAIQNAFKFDESKLSLDMSGLNNLSIDTSGMTNMAMPEMNIGDMTTLLAGQINVPADALTGILQGVIGGFIAEAGDVQLDAPTFVAMLTAYLAKPDVQASISAQVSTLMDESQVEAQIQGALQAYMGNILQGFTAQLMGQMGSMQAQIASSIQSQMETAMSGLPAQIQDALSIDEEALASAFKIEMSEDDIMELMTAMMTNTESTYDNNLVTLGYADPNSPSQISFYPLDFSSKDQIEVYIKEYNDKMTAENQEDKVVSYSDIVGTMMASVTTIVDTISYALIAFVAISLIVSSIMIGVITYISVLERKKEIGILRALGASKGDIRTVFNAETLIIGFVAGILGIGLTEVICFIGNIIVYEKLDIKNIAQLPVEAALILIGVSMFLAFVSGLFPSSAAARKDPVEALRSE